jgi:hypothetical protein
MTPLMTEGRMVRVRLSDVPLDLRHTVAQEAIDRNRMRADEALKIRLAAEAVFGDPSIMVPAWKVEIVMTGKRPPGNTPEGIW